MQSALARMLGDRDRLARFLGAVKATLADSFSLLRSGLEAHGILFVEPKVRVSDSVLPSPPTSCQISFRRFLSRR